MKFICLDNFLKISILPAFIEYKKISLFQFYLVFHPDMGNIY